MKKTTNKVSAQVNEVIDAETKQPKNKVSTKVDNDKVANDLLKIAKKSLFSHVSDALLSFSAVGNIFADIQKNGTKEQKEVLMAAGLANINFKSSKLLMDYLPDKFDKNGCFCKYRILKANEDIKDFPEDRIFTKEVNRIEEIDGKKVAKKVSVTVLQERQNRFTPSQFFTMFAKAERNRLNALRMIEKEAKEEAAKKAKIERLQKELAELQK